MLELLPDGKTFKKLNRTQTKALNNYYLRLHDKPPSPQDFVLPVGLIISGGVLAGAYIFKDTIKEHLLTEYEKFKVTALDATGGGIYNVVDFVITFFRAKRPEWQEPTEPESPAEVVLPDGETVVLTTCQRYENDIVDLYATIPNSGWFLRTRRLLHGLAINDKLDTMKKAGCTKPAGVTQRDWDKAT